MGDLRKWYQQEFQFDFSVPVTVQAKTPRRKTDYGAIVKALQKGPLTFTQIEQIAGCARSGVSQIITTLSLHYPIYEAKRGVYKLYGDDDYGDGINHEALKEYGYE